MYDPHQVLLALDANKLNVILLCGLAMIFNYIWFAQAAIRGFRVSGPAVQHAVLAMR